MEEDRAVVPHARLAARFVADADRTTWHDAALWFVRVKRDRAAAHVPEWEELRELASRIKAHLMSRLPEYLEQFESNAARNGAVVHWARDGEEHNRIVLEILNRHNARRVVKSKSMLTEECRLNPYLEARGIGVVDTDLGERIVQLRNEPPSHIVLPAIHLRKADVGATFHEQLGTPAGESDAGRLTRAACDHLRERFLAADAAITGVNFGIAETGGIVVCTNEGNADLGASIPRLHIASMGKTRSWCPAPAIWRSSRGCSPGPPRVNRSRPTHRISMARAPEPNCISFSSTTAAAACSRAGRFAEPSIASGAARA